MLDSDNDAWRLVQAAARAARGPVEPERGRRYALDGENLEPVVGNDDAAVLAWDRGWQLLPNASQRRLDCCELYLPLASARATAPLVIGQLGQSIDGCIATASGHSHYVTGESSILHLHRLRALSDCVIVGAGTVAADDPRLTTRRVGGPNPVRVILDPRLRLPITHQVFSDAQAPTLRVRAQGVPLPPQRTCANVQDIAVPAPAGQLDLFALLAELRARGHHAILVEGGGVTLSAFMAAGLLDRMHIAVAPVIIGAGRPGLRPPSPLRMQDCVRPPPRIYALGNDVLFDCDLRSGCAPDDPPQVIRRLM